MARRTQISKEVILEAAFRMLLRDGYASDYYFGGFTFSYLFAVKYCKRNVD